MSTKLFPFALGIVFILVTARGLRADLVEMQNGDRYFGKVVSVSADTLVLESEMLGKVNVPRKGVASLAFGTNSVALKLSAEVAPVAGKTNLPAAAPLAGLMKTNLNLPAALRDPAATTNSLRQIREQMLASSPEATVKFNEMLAGLMTGKLGVSDIRREAKSVADQLREFKRDLGPEAGGAYDGYLDILDHFLKETDATPPAKP